MRIALIGGTFDDLCGRSSGYVQRLHHELNAERDGCGLINGGLFHDLQMTLSGSLWSLSSPLGEYEALLWFADVPNDKPKLVNDIKRRWPKILLVTSKRNFDREYPISELLGRALKTKSNLLIEMTGAPNRVEATLLDPLGSMYCEKEKDIGRVAHVLLDRLQRLTQFERIGSEQVGERIEPPNEPEFYRIVQEQAERFHAIIHGVGHERMMGNASFRCAKGFPSTREGATIFVSRRDVDKRYIGPEAFVAVELSSKDRVRYYGADKPSVDTPIQVRLYQYYSNVRYMLHSHTYIQGAPTTSEPLPCGAIEEADAVQKLVPSPLATDFAINLRGHGSLVLASGLDFLRDQPWIPREIPEPTSSI